MCESQSVPAVFRGLLECPLRQGYVDFEYAKGDHVSLLKKRIAEVWGTAKVGRSKAQLIKYYHMVIQGWVILCEDQDGMYIILRDKDEIPLATPETVHIERENYGHPKISVTENAQKLLEETGVIHNIDIETGSFHFKFNRVYDIPKGIKYSVRLIVLVALVGG